MDSKFLDSKLLPKPEGQKSVPLAAAGRRRALIGGGAVLAAMNSGSALAGGICVSPSSFSSIKANSKTSNKPKTFGACSSHGFYGNGGVSSSTMDTRWSPVSRANATLSNAGFPSYGKWGPTSPASAFVGLNTKLYAIVSAPGNPAWYEEGNLVVIYLDVMTGRAGSTTSVDDVKNMWRVLFMSGVGITDPKYNSWTPETVRSFYDVWVGNTAL